MSVISSLFSSRKFVIVLLAVVVLAVFVGLGKMPVADFFSSLEKFVMVLVVAIGAEGVAEKWNTTPLSPLKTAPAAALVEGVAAAPAPKDPS